MMPVMAAKAGVTDGPRSKQKLLKFFEEADKDHNGYLSMKELKAALKKQGYNLSQAKIKKQFLQFDLDGDNKISRDEFLTCMGEMPNNVHEAATLRRMFQAFDKNGDGIIDRTEIRLVFAEMRRKNMTTLDLDSLMKLVDRDGDGVINYEEFVKFFERKFT